MFTPSNYGRETIFTSTDLPGMHTQFETLSGDGDQYVKTAQNVRFTKLSTFEKRSALRDYNDTLGAIATAPIDGIFRYSKSDGNNYVAAICNGSVYSIGPTATAIRTLGISGKRASFVVFQNLLICGDGYNDIWVWDGGAVTWELGACKAAVGAGTGITRTSISYMISYDADAYICGAISNEIASTTNNDIELTNIPLGPAGITNRKIFRKSSETGGLYKLIATITDAAQTTYTDTTADASGAAAIGAVTDDMPKCAILKKIHERLFMTGNPSYPNYIYYSVASLPHYVQHVVNLTYLDVGTNDGDIIQNMAARGNILYAIKRAKTYPVVIQPSMADSDWYADKPVDIGTTSRWAVCEIPDGILFPTEFGLFVINDSSYEPVIPQFSLRSEVAMTRRDEMVAEYCNGYVFLLYASVGSAYEDRIMVFDYQSKKMSIDKFNLIAGAGIRSIHSWTNSSGATSIVFGNATSGYLYYANDVQNDWVLTDPTTMSLYSVSAYYGTTDATTYLECLHSSGIASTGAINLNAGTFISSTYATSGTGGSVSFFIRTGDTETVDDFSACTVDHTADKFTAAGHGLVNGDRVQIAASTLPTGISNNIMYYAVGVVGNDFQVSLTLDGSAVAFSSNGASVTFKEWTACSDITAITAKTWSEFAFYFVSTSSSIWDSFAWGSLAWGSASPLRVTCSGVIVLKIEYTEGGSVAESSVPMRYELGDRVLDSPMADRFYKQVNLIIESMGTPTLTWSTELASNTLSITDAYGRFKSFLHDNAFGGTINLEVSQDDLKSCELKKIGIVVEPAGL